MKSLSISYYEREKAPFSEFMGRVLPERDIEDGVIKSEGVRLVKRTPEVLAAIFFCLAVVLLIHQQLTSNDVWFNWQQFLHHESFIAGGFIAAIALLLGKYLGRRGLEP